MSSKVNSEIYKKINQMSAECSWLDVKMSLQNIAMQTVDILKMIGSDQCDPLITVTIHRIHKYNKYKYRRIISEGDFAKQQDENEYVNINTGFVGKSIREKESIIVSDVKNKKHKNIYNQVNSQTRSELIFPIVDQDGVVYGAINAESSAKKYFNNDIFVEVMSIISGFILSKFIQDDTNSIVQYIKSIHKSACKRRVIEIDDLKSHISSICRMLQLELGAGSASIAIFNDNIGQSYTFDSGINEIPCDKHPICEHSAKMVISNDFVKKHITSRAVIHLTKIHLGEVIDITEEDPNCCSPILNDLYLSVFKLSSHLSCIFIIIDPVRPTTSYTETKKYFDVVNNIIKRFIENRHYRLTRLQRDFISSLYEKNALLVNKKDKHSFHRNFISNEENFYMKLINNFTKAIEADRCALYLHSKQGRLYSLTSYSENFSDEELNSIISKSSIKNLFSKGQIVTITPSKRDELEYISLFMKESCFQGYKTSIFFAVLLAFGGNPIGIIVGHKRDYKVNKLLEIIDENNKTESLLPRFQTELPRFLHLRNVNSINTLRDISYEVFIREISKATGNNNINTLFIKTHNIVKKILPFNTTLFSIYTRNHTDSKSQLFEMASETKKTFSKLLSNYTPSKGADIPFPTFEPGEGLTGLLIDSSKKTHNGNLINTRFEPFIEKNGELKTECKRFWNTIVGTDKRFFYGRSFDYPENHALSGKTQIIITLNGKREEPYNESVFYPVVDSIFYHLGLYIKNEIVQISKIPEHAKIDHAFISKYPRENNIFLMIRYHNNDQERKKYFNQVRDVICNAIPNNFNLIIADGVELGTEQTLLESVKQKMLHSKYGIAILDQYYNEPTMAMNILWEHGFMTGASSESLLVLKDSTIHESPSLLDGLLVKNIDLSNLITVHEAITSWVSGLK